jgi:hypothetical protein
MNLEGGKAGNGLEFRVDAGLWGSASGCWFLEVRNAKCEMRNWSLPLDFVLFVFIPDLPGSPDSRAMASGGRHPPGYPPREIVRAKMTAPFFVFFLRGFVAVGFDG